VEPYVDAAAAAGPWIALVGLVAGAIRALFTGQLVTASQVDRLTVQWEARITEAAEQAEARIAESHEREQLWRTAWERSEEARRVESAQVGELIPVARATEALLRAIPVGGGSPPTRPLGIPGTRGARAADGAAD
jgi:hypothetical protein